MTSHMERVLVALGLILVLEAITTEAALVLLLSLMGCQLLGRLKLFRLLWAALAHVETL